MDGSVISLLLVYKNVKQEPEREKQDIGAYNNDPYILFVFLGIKMNSINQHNPVEDLKKIKRPKRISIFFI